MLDQVKDRYDVILIDCAPSLGLLTINALTAADKVIMPLECEFFALRGIALLTDTIAKVQDRLNPRLEILGILGTMYDPARCTAGRCWSGWSRPSATRVFHTVIRRTVKFPETTVAGEPITTYATDLAGRRGVPHAGAGGAGPMSRRVSLPGASELFRDTKTKNSDHWAGEHAGAAPPVRAGCGTTRRSPSTSAPTSCWRWSRPG